MNIKNKTFATILRYLFGLFMLFIGLNGLFQFVGEPNFNEAGMAFLMALFNSGYIIPIISVINILVAVSLLTNKYVALAMILLAPITLNYVFFHLFLDMAGVVAALIPALLNIYFASLHWDQYKALFEK